MLFQYTFDRDWHFFLLFHSFSQQTQCEGAFPVSNEPFWLLYSLFYHIYLGCHNSHCIPSALWSSSYWIDWGRRRKRSREFIWWYKSSRCRRRKGRKGRKMRGKRRMPSDGNERLLIRRNKSRRECRWMRRRDWKEMNEGKKKKGRNWLVVVGIGLEIPLIGGGTIGTNEFSD